MAKSKKYFQESTKRVKFRLFGYVFTEYSRLLFKNSGKTLIFWPPIALRLKVFTTAPLQAGLREGGALRYIDKTGQMK
ncbi:MAG: hypothetical protein DRP52_04745 [Planctomycetota bacterium]|nr:MAG: hypothetical protein DRP52_04745 [Planctomycetota bacterium]